MELSKHSSRRRHGADFKARVLAECAQPGASVAAVAMSHGLNANLVHRWRRLASVEAGQRSQPAVTAQQFVPLVVTGQPAAADIRIELRRGATTVSVSWPQACAAECAGWLRELLQ